jgi:hypothetical protein
VLTWIAKMLIKQISQSGSLTRTDLMGTRMGWAAKRNAI